MGLISNRARALVVSAALATTTLVSGSHEARAADPDTVEWSDDWPRFRWTEVLATGLFVGQALTAVYLYPTPPIRWRGGILFDDAVRDAIKPDSHDAREALRAPSDNLYYGAVLFPFIVDTALVAGAIHGSGDVALQMFAMNLESFALSGALTLTGQKLGRERPAGRECGNDPEYSPKCHSEKGLTESFYSGHTASVFTSAGLTCAHHQHLPLYGGGLPDTLACVVMLAAGTTEGVFRVMTDDHYTSDVLIGAGVGLASGYLLPSLLHYGFANDAKARGERSFLPIWRTANGGAMILAPQIGPEYGGVSLLGMY
jgi:membrane-associated phospholipid phosphatase